MKFVFLIFFAYASPTDIASAPDNIVPLLKLILGHDNSCDPAKPPFVPVTFP